MTLLMLPKGFTKVSKKQQNSKSYMEVTINVIECNKLIQSCIIKRLLATDLKLCKLSHLRIFSESSDAQGVGNL